MVKLLKKILISEFGLKLKEKFYPTKNGDPDTATHLMQAMKRFHESDNKKSPSRIKREIQICKNYWKCYPHHYFINNLLSVNHFMKNVYFSSERLYHLMIISNRIFHSAI